MIGTNMNGLIHERFGKPHHRSSAFSALLALTIVSLGCGPMLLLPGGELSGAATPAPASWDFTQEIDTIQLESRPSDPYSVNIWVTNVGTSLYLHAGANRANWIENIEVDPNVRVRIDAKIYELRATRVTEATEFERFADAYEEKYGSRPRNENVNEAYLMRLEERS